MSRNLTSPRPTPTSRARRILCPGQDRSLAEDGILLNVGLRYDILDPRAERPAIEAIPVSDEEYEFAVASTVPASVKHSVSPRIGAAMQLTEHGFLFVNVGKYVQYPMFDYLYTGLDRIALAGGIPALTGNPD